MFLQKFHYLINHFEIKYYALNKMLHKICSSEFNCINHEIKSGIFYTL